jgi:hypothetical protein
MTRRIAIINPVGVEGGGATTLCVQYAGLGIDCWMKNTVDYANSIVATIPNIKPYSTDNDLLDIATKYDRLLFVNMWFGHTMPDNVIDNVIKLRKNYPNLEICYIHCCRGLGDLYTLLPVCQQHNFMFDYIFSLHPQITSFPYCKSVFMNINACILPDYSPLSVNERNNIVFTSGRVEGFKGVVKYFNSIDDDFLASTGKFTYIHEGAKYSHHKNNDGISCPPQMLSIFDTTTSPKSLKPQYVLRDYGQEPLCDKFNIYPSYDMRFIRDRWKHYFAGICCVLGTTSGYMVEQTLFGTEYKIKDKRERTLIDKRTNDWGDTLEYADIEKMSFGVPVFFSRKFSQIIGFTDERLIYNSFSEIPEKVKLLHTYYDDVREAQYTWLHEKLQNVNATILEKFTGDIN